METINGIRQEPSHPMPWLLQEGPVPIKISGGDKGRRLLTIRTAECARYRRSAHSLVSRMYAAKGYSTTAPLTEHSNPRHVTFVATEQDVTVGTITVGCDGAGLLVEESFGDYVERLRDEGAVLCEFIKFAIDGVVRSKRVLASLMQAALVCAREVHGSDKALIEVNPRHVRFYEAVLGFSVLVKERHNYRVNAPAVLMCLDLGCAGRRLAEAHERGRSSTRSSIYHQGFSLEETAGLIDQLRRGRA